MKKDKSTRGAPKPQNERILILDRLHKKGFLQFFFSRGLGLLLLMAIQVFVVFFMYVLFASYMPHYTVIQLLFQLAVLLYIFNCDMDSTPKLTWLWIIMLLPVPGSILFLFTKTEFGYNKIKRSLQIINEKQVETIPANEDVFNEINDESTGLYELITYINKTGPFPVYNDTDVTYYPLGEDMYEAYLEELSKAEKYIFIEFFIIEEGDMWGSILKILTEKAAQGVDVRVMYDGMCEISALPKSYYKLVRLFGIKCKPFLPIKPILSTAYNYRDHRKITVIDGKVSFTGGVNL
ncbi:MAG: PLDc N-terminal domain-containing protein, partial [Lachnospiraceae bacterium]|nr:PLDc N-terminal domain-containing protein [Lachnospiraceae bacterium]